MKYLGDIQHNKDLVNKKYVDDADSRKMNKASNPTANDILVTDANGQAVDSGVQLSAKQDTLVSGTSIKTINGESVLGSGDIEIGGGIFIAEQNVTTAQEIIEALGTGKVIYVRLSSPSILYLVNNLKIINENTVRLICYIGKDNLEDIVLHITVESSGWSNHSIQFQNKLESGTNIKTVNGTDILGSGNVDTTPPEATETISGTVKLNPAQNITSNANGQLEVGGRMGQFPTTTGMYAPNNRDPRNVGNYSFLITDAMGMDLNANRSMAVVSGLGLPCRSAAAGSTEYRIQNNYANRIQAILCAGGYAARDEATSTTQRIVPVVSVTINGSSFTPDSSANPSGTTSDIVIKTAETLNPDTAITNIRLFGKMGSYATLHAGNGIASESGGRNLLLGGGVTKSGSSNDNCLVGNGIYSSGNGNACFGRYHIARKNRGFLAGTGHDTTNAPSEGASAVGQYSYMDSGTLFAVGNGSSHTARSNAFEVTSDGGVVLKSPNGTRWKLTVDDSGNLTTTAL